MNDRARNETLRSIFKAAMTQAAVPVDPNQYHPIDDEELLIDWSVGDLDDVRYHEVIEHLSECSRCRHELASMIEDGVLVLPEQDEETEVDEQVQATPRDRAPESHSRRPALVFAAVAASLLIAIVWGFSLHSGESAIAMADRDLKAGRHQVAIGRMETYLDANGQMSPEERKEALRILEASSYNLAIEHLGSDQPNHLERVVDINGQAARRGVSSGRLTNLSIQAQRGEVELLSLSTRIRLPEYGFKKDGTREKLKSIGMVSLGDSIRRIEKALVQAIKTHPDSMELRLNYGQFLLENRSFKESADQFRQVIDIAPKDYLAHMGLALSLFQQKGEDPIHESLKHFRKAVELDEDNPEANLNLAICLMRLGKTDEAKPFFEKSQEKAEKNEL